MIRFEKENEIVIVVSLKSKSSSIIIRTERTEEKKEMEHNMQREDKPVMRRLAN